MAREIFSNNAKSFLATGIDTSATTISVATGYGSLFPFPSGGDWSMLTLEEGSNREIVKLTTRSGDTLTVVRAQESTSAKSFTTAATISCRITSALMDRVPQNNGDTLRTELILGDDSTNAATYANVSNKTTPFAWAAATHYGLGQTVTILNTNGHNTVAQCIVPGLSGATSPVIGTTISSTVTDNTVTWKSLSPDTTTYANYSVALGPTSYVGNVQSIAIGNSAAALHGSAIALNGTAYGLAGISLGGISYGVKSSAIGYVARTYTDSSTNISGIFAIQPPFSKIGSELDKSSGYETTIFSDIVDLTGGSTWAASTSYLPGNVVHPTTPNGRQYYMLPSTNAATSGTSGTTEPSVWGTTQGSYVSDSATVTWMTSMHNTNGYEITLPVGGRFYVTGVGFVAINITAVTVQPFLSWGIVGTPNSLQTSIQTTDLTANYTMQSYAVTGKAAVTTLSAAIPTLATGTALTGRFFWKGYFIVDPV